MAKIRSVVVEGDRQNGLKGAQVFFGTNYFLESSRTTVKLRFSWARIIPGSKPTLRAPGRTAEYISEVQERHPERALAQE